MPVVSQPNATNQIKLTFLPSDCADDGLRELCCFMDGYFSANIVRFTRENWNGRLSKTFLHLGMCRYLFRHFLVCLHSILSVGMIGQCTRLGFIRFQTVEKARKAVDYFGKAKRKLGYFYPNESTLRSTRHSLIIFLAQSGEG